jgi:Tfp pilus assembly protein PilV
MRARRRSHGITILEIVVSAAIIATAVTGIAGAWQLYLKVSNYGTQYIAASLLTEETGEALTLMRDASWTNYIGNLSLNTPYYLYWNGSSYSATTTQQVSFSSYLRTFTLSAVKRDANDNVSSSGTTDTDTKDVIISVVLSANASTTVSQSEMLIHNVYQN